MSTILPDHTTVGIGKHEIKEAEKNSKEKVKKKKYEMKRKFPIRQFIFFSFPALLSSKYS